MAVPAQRVESWPRTVCRQGEARLLGGPRRAPSCSPCAHRRRREATVRWKHRKPWSQQDEGRGLHSVRKAAALPQRSEGLVQTFCSSSHVSM